MRRMVDDFRRDWGRWSRAERFTAKLVGAALLYLGFVLTIAPNASAWPW